MENLEMFREAKIQKEKVFQGLLIAVIIVGIGILGHFGTKLKGINIAELWKDLQATLYRPAVEKPAPEGIAEGVDEVLTSEALAIEGEKIVEVAKKGEGITHLARRALKQYLGDNLQPFEVTPEHKVYIEDYIAKKMGGRPLKLGEKLEISGDLIKEAIEKAENLSPEQLKNLEQYSQLVPSLNY